MSETDNLLGITEEQAQGDWVAANEELAAARRACELAWCEWRLAWCEWRLARARRDAVRCRPGDDVAASWRAVLREREADVERARAALTDARVFGPDDAPHAVG